jgi:hypothetical protein
MILLYQTYQETTNSWQTIGSLTSLPSGQIERKGLDGLTIGTEPFWCETLQREVEPNEGDLYLKVLEKGASNWVSRLVPPDDQLTGANELVPITP